MAELPSFDPYQVLGVDKNADATSIKKAYRKLALLKHPDKCTDEALRSARTDEFQQLNEAYDILGDDDKRKRHDALVKLDALRKQKASMSAHPRSFTRASTFHSGFSTSANTAYTSRGATNVEDRAPKVPSDDDDFFKFPRRYTDHDFSRRSAPPPSRERTKSDKDAAERRRGERLRDNGIRSARSSKYDYADAKSDHDYRPEDDKRSRGKDTRSTAPTDPLGRKYVDQVDDFFHYTASMRSRPAMETRPSMSRRASTRVVPPAQVRRSSAAPKDFSKSQREYEDREILDRERQRREKDEKARRKERERRDKDRDNEYEPVSPRARRSENVGPYEQRPPSLQHAKSSPPYAADEIREPISRTNTEPFSVKHNTPPMPRSKTMPTAASNSSNKRTPQPSKLRNSMRHDDVTDGSSSTSESDQERRRRKATPIRYSYAKVEEPVLVEERDARQTRTVSPEPARPSSGAIKMAKLASAQRPAAVHSRSSSGYSIPMRGARSPDRSARRDRSRSREREPMRSKKLYGEFSPESPRRSSLGNISYSKHIRPQDIVYAQRPATGRRDREREPYEGFSRPEMHRSPSIPIHTVSQ